MPRMRKRGEPGGRATTRPYWALAPTELLVELKTTALGLAGPEARARLQHYGHNQLRAHGRGPLAAAVVAQLRNPLLWLLAVAAVTSSTVGEASDSIVIVAILVLGTLISIVQDARAGHVLASLRERVALRSRVLRDAHEVDIPASELVPGDVIVLSAGVLVPADAVVLEAKDLSVAEAALTGESFPVDKLAVESPEGAELADRRNVVHMGTNVRSGMGRAVVVATGSATEFGDVARRLTLRAAETEFQHGLRRFGYVLVTTMLVLVVVVFGASAIRRHPPVEALLFAIAIAVGIAPEMLPAVLASMLSRGARRMAARGVLVRKLDAIENLGNMDVLCTDKTGTLTEGEVRLQAAVDPAGEASAQVARLALWNAALQTGIANPLDRAIVGAATETQPLPTKLDEIPFDFVRRRLSVVVAEESQDEPLLVTKGAFEAVMAVCASVRIGGTPVILDSARHDRLQELADAHCRNGVRVLAVATRRLQRGIAVDRDSERELVLEGFLMFRDPPKAGAAKAIADLRVLDVDVKIVSGDHRDVVRHLATEVGLRTDEIATGRELAEMRAEALGHAVERIDLFAEVDPVQKERILLALKRRGHVVGFMGDGINDAPAMHVADVGISVEGATDVAREAADFVLLRRDLDTVRAGVIEGRTTFANTLKYLLTTESANLGNMVSMAGAALFLPFLPLLAQQVLLNNLLSDVPSAALAVDGVDAETLARPRRWNLPFLRRFMIAFGLVSAAFDGITFVFLTVVMHATPEVFRTAWFVVSVWTELFVLLVLRTRRRAWASRPHPALLATTLVVAMIAALVPLSPLRSALGFTELPAFVWAAMVGITAAYVATVEATKGPILRWIDRHSAGRTAPRE